MFLDICLSILADVFLFAIFMLLIIEFNRRDDYDILEIESATIPQENDIYDNVYIKNLILELDRYVKKMAWFHEQKCEEEVKFLLERSNCITTRLKEKFDIE